MIILHSSYNQTSKDFVAQHSADSSLIIDWFSSDTNEQIKKQRYISDGGIIPSDFPMIVSPSVPVAIIPKTENPQGELETAIADFYNQRMIHYGSEGYGTTWAELVTSGILNLANAKQTVVTEIKAEAESRIVKIWSAANITDALVAQINTLRTDSTDERFTRTDAIRAASNQFESDIKAMTKKKLATVNVSDWAGWPVSDNN